MATNFHKKATYMDYFARKWYTPRTAAKVAKDNKRAASRIYRRKLKLMVRDELATMGI